MYFKKQLKRRKCCAFALFILVSMMATMVGGDMVPEMLVEVFWIIIFHQLAVGVEFRISCWDDPE